jgi:hypothetical protein
MMPRGSSAGEGGGVPVSPPSIAVPLPPRADESWPWCLAYRDADDGDREIYLAELYQSRRDSQPCAFTRTQRDAMRLPSWSAAVSLLMSLGLSERLYPMRIR